MYPLGAVDSLSQIALAPMVPEWLKKNDGPTISVKIMAGIPSLTPDEKQNPKKMKSAYERLSFGGSTRKSQRWQQTNNLQILFANIIKTTNQTNQIWGSENSKQIK
jgi:hypothetical protein